MACPCGLSKDLMGHKGLLFNDLVARFAKGCPQCQAAFVWHGTAAKWPRMVEAAMAAGWEPGPHMEDYMQHLIRGGPHIPDLIARRIECIRLVLQGADAAKWEPYIAWAERLGLDTLASACRAHVKSDTVTS